MTTNSHGQPECITTAAAILYLIEGSTTRVEQALALRASPSRLRAVATPPRHESQQRRAQALAIYPQHLATQLHTWSLR